jgi:hypothetical protein
LHAARACEPRLLEHVSFARTKDATFPVAADNRWSSIFVVAVSESFPHEREADVSIDQTERRGFRGLISEAEVVEQRFRAVVAPS